MSTCNLRKRVEKVEAMMCPRSDGSFTLVELCRAIWQDDKKAYLKMVKNNPALGVLVSQFEQEDLE